MKQQVSDFTHSVADVYIIGQLIRRSIQVKHIQFYSGELSTAVAYLLMQACVCMQGNSHSIMPVHATLQ